MMKGCSNLNRSFFLLVLACIIITVSYNFCTNYELLVVEVEVMRRRCVGIRFPLVLDWVGLFFSRAVVLISGCVIIFSSFYIDHEEFPGRFVGLVMLFVLSINFLIFIPSVFGLMVG